MHATLATSRTMIALAILVLLYNAWQYLHDGDALPSLFNWQLTEHWRELHEQQITARNHTAPLTAHMQSHGVTQLQ